MGFSLSGPLPGVFAAVGEEGVRTGDVEATLVDGRLPGCRLASHVESFKNSGAEVDPVLRVDESRAHGMNFARSLEPAILCADLVVPLPAGVINVDLLAVEF